MKLILFGSLFVCALFILFNILNVFLNFKLNKKWMLYIFLIVLCSIAIITINTKPNIADDLYRHFNHIDNFRAKGLSYYSDFPYSSNFITFTLFYLVSLTPYNNLLPLVVVILFYLSGFIFFMNAINNNAINNTRYISLFLIAFVSFVYLNETISGVRSPLAIALFLLVFNFDKNNSKIYNVLYFIPIFVHPFSIVLTGLVYFTKFYMSKKELLNAHFDIRYLTVFLPYLCILISPFIPENIPYISDIFRRLLIYSNPSFYIDYIDMRVQICFMVMLLIIIYLFYKNKKHLMKSCYYYSFMESLIFFIIGVLPFPIIQGRYFTVLFLFSFPLFFEIEKLNKISKSIIVVSVFIISIGLFSYRMVNAYNFWRFY